MDERNGWLITERCNWETDGRRILEETKNILACVRRAFANIFTFFSSAGGMKEKNWRDYGLSRERTLERSSYEVGNKSTWYLRSYYIYDRVEPDDSSVSPS